MKKSELLKEGYVKGLKNAQKIIANVLNESVGGAKYEARIYGAFTREDNYKKGEIDYYDWGIEKNTIPFNTIEELKKKICSSYDGWENGDFYEYGGERGDDIEDYVYAWYTTDSDNMNQYTNADKAAFKAGKINVFEHNVAFSIFPRQMESIKLEDIK